MAGDKDYTKLTRDIYDAYSRGDWNVLQGNIADNATLVANALGKTLKGRANVVDYYRNHKQAFDLTVSVQRVIACGDSAVVEYQARGTHKAPYTLPNGDVAQPTGRAMNLSVCHVLLFKNDKVSEVHTYFDLVTMMTQMGVGLTQESHRN